MRHTKDLGCVEGDGATGFEAEEAEGFGGRIADEEEFS